MADISRYSIQFAADPSQAVNAFGKVGKSAVDSAAKIDSAYKRINSSANAATANLNKTTNIAQGTFSRLASGARFSNFQNMLQGISARIGSTIGSIGSLGSVFGSLSGSIGAFAAAGGPVTAAIAAVVALGAATIAAANHIDQLDDTAKRLGTTVASLQTIGLAAGEAGSSLQDVTNIMQIAGANLADAQNGIGGAAKALEALGLSANELLGMAPEQRLVAISNRMRELNLTLEEQSALWQDIGGRAARGQFVAFAQNLSENLENARHELELMGALVSGQTANTAAFLTDMIGRIRIIFESIGNMMVTNLGPVIAAMAKWLQAAWIVLAPIVSLVMQIASVVLKPMLIALTGVTILLRIIGSLLQAIGAFLKIAFLPFEIFFGILQEIFDQLAPVFQEIEKAFLEIKHAIEEMLSDPAIRALIKDMGQMIADWLIPAIRAFAESVKFVAKAIRDAREFLRQRGREVGSTAATGAAIAGYGSVGAGSNIALALAARYVEGRENQVVQAVNNVESAVQQVNDSLQSFDPSRWPVIGPIMQIPQTITQGLGMLVTLANLVQHGNELAQQANQQFSADVFGVNVRALQAALSGGTITQTQFQSGIGRQIQALRQFVGQGQNEVGQRGMVQGSVEAVTMMLQTQYGQVRRNVEEEIAALLAEANQIQQGIYTEEQAQTQAIQSLFGNNPLGPINPMAIP